MGISVVEHFKPTLSSIPRILALHFANLLDANTTLSQSLTQQLLLTFYFSHLDMYVTNVGQYPGYIISTKKTN